MIKTRKRRNTGRVTLQDVAKHAGVGSMTVSRALRTPELVSDKLREKVNLAVEELGYIPNASAGALASAQSHIIAVLLPSFTDRASADFMQSLQQILNRHQYQILVGCYEHQPHKANDVINMLLQSNPAALVAFGSQLSPTHFLHISNANVPVVSVASQSDEQAAISIDCSYEQAAYDLTNHLVSQGKRCIGYIGALQGQRLHHQQITGWSRALLKNYLNAEQSVTTPDPASMAYGRQALTEILLRQPELDAVICSHESIALGMIFECQRRLIKIPQDLAIACLEGSENSDQISPSLTTIRFDYHKMGKEAGKHLIALLQRLRDEDDNAIFEDTVINYAYRFELGQSTP
ncbi:MULTISPECIES: LacI family DNA-binding transcriptional regulator [Proteus]|uniref:HTH-type transcriptional regulator GntR n=2 Tax=Gammaproteobacteria TaxID=1236 RepID=A0A0G4Q3R7_9GAMM|nr:MULTISPECIES: LacI family DNA-binding transcriptional regulator [Proteus]EEG85964.1 transcriptional regulator, LacI family [Proteus penneri ATCC 35198]MCO8049284.1 LacI family transcriptional regulator [Proteus penneri]MCX2587326.1 LacI family transcriptional regulator [Proteus penneri]NBL78869.1 substrate-binding domain-containing protein [Proteus sp. G2672]NBM04788.1 substrate-binding domain-containing protein [Proteus sp. G2671]